MRLPVLLTVLLCLVAGAARAADPTDWPAVEGQARGQTVYFHAWGGSPDINRYIAWAGERLQAEHGVTLVQVKLEDTATAVAAVLAEKVAGRTSGGAVDLVWINGENFAAMKREGLLGTQDWASHLPNRALVDPAARPVLVTDFTVPTDGLESPWGLAQLVFFHDSAREAGAMPRSFMELVAWAEAHPGRFTYPAPPDFMGSTLLKQGLVELAPDRAVLREPPTEQSFAAATAPLFAALDRLRPVLWRSGRTHPANKEEMRRLLADGEIDIAFAFSPSEASAAIASGELPDTVRSFVFEGGTLANAHFVAIPFNANAREGALVTANFLLSAEAQLHKENPAVWGDPTVLAMDRLDPATAQAFADLDRGVATLSPAQLGRALDEPHPAWMERLEAEWQLRYASGR